MTKPINIVIEGGNIADAVDALRDQFLAAKAPIFIDSRERLVMRMPDGAIVQLNSIRLRYWASHYGVTFTRDDKPIKPPGSLLTMFIDVAVTYSWFEHLQEE
jgi:hypothetical protein